MKRIKIKAPAKINLVLEVLNRRADGFHEISSIMQAVSLYDFLTIEMTEQKDECNLINLSGTNTQIPYNEKNLVYQAAQAFLAEIGAKNVALNLFLEKNIPIEAGLAGGSTDAAAAFYGLNKLFGEILPEQSLHKLCSALGSDLNFCLSGGTALCKGRGEIIEPLAYKELPVSLIKPKNLGISAKEAYIKFSTLEQKPENGNSEKLKTLLAQGKFDKSLLVNHLETAVIKDYPEISFIKKHEENSMMSGSGPTFFALKEKPNYNFDPNEYLVISGLKTINHGVIEA